MKTDVKTTKSLVVAIATLAAASFVWTGCDSHDEDGHDHGGSGGGHTSPYPACNDIVGVCHEVDVGEGEIHDCHNTAHGATGDAECAAIKDRCLQICTEAMADGGSNEHDGG